jgi:UV DNA damage endonuclease
MPIRLGYACINTQLPSSNRTCRLENATPERILELARQNLSALEAVLCWNVDHRIRLFRISSEVIPFGSHPVNTLPWWELLASELSDLDRIIRESGMRVSMHPGQYTVLNAMREAVVESTLAELGYHTRFLDSLGVDFSHKIILHVGGTYGEKARSLQRFAENFLRLPEGTHRRLVVENDEKSYTLSDTLALAEQIGTPVIFDVFHHAWNSYFPGASLRALVERAAATWKLADGPSKLHYSDQWPGKSPGSHSQSVDIEAFGEFYHQVQDLEVDIMLEVKDKEHSVLALYDRFPDLISG